jgi:DNA-directed RNA polymerase specialized sigma24 family protein
VVLRYYEDLADVDIANLLGCSPATVRVHAFKALKKLRTALEKNTQTQLVSTETNP